MTLDEFNAFCGSMVGTHKVIQWGGAHVWKVGSKVFAICSFWGEDRQGRDGKPAMKIAFKCSDFSFEMLTSQKGIIPAPYLARGKWVQVESDTAISDEDLRLYLQSSWAIISKKLTKAQRQDLGINGSS